MSDNNYSYGDMLFVGMIVWVLILSIPIAVAGDLGFFILNKLGVLNNAPKFLYVLSWIVPALLYGYYVKKFISKFLTQDSFGIGVLMYAQGFLVLGIIALYTDGGIFVSKIIILGLNDILGGGWLTNYGLMFGLSFILFLLGFLVVRNYPIPKKQVRKRYV
jgi:hypothetical protein